jgi:Na+-driven multidrug efflux pump
MTPQEAKYQRMTTEPVSRLVTSLAIPSMGSMMVSALYNIVDTYFVSQTGTQATAALGVVFTYMVLIQAFSFFFGQGSGNYISRALGARRTEQAA